VYNYLRRRFRDSVGVQGREQRHAEGKQTTGAIRFFGARVLNFPVPPFDQRGQARRGHVPSASQAPDFLVVDSLAQAEADPVVSWTKGAESGPAGQRLRHHLFNLRPQLERRADSLFRAGRPAASRPRHRHKIFLPPTTRSILRTIRCQRDPEQIKPKFGIPFQKMVLFTAPWGLWRTARRWTISSRSFRT